MKALLNFPLIPIYPIYLVFQFITRGCLCAAALIKSQIYIREIPSIFFTGIMNDLVTMTYFAPLLFIITSVFSYFFKKRVKLYKILSLVGYFIAIALLLFILIAQIIFWDEFGSNFNFIAVDYLIYTHEIIGTMKESLPIYKILCIFFISSILITYFTRNHILKEKDPISIKVTCLYLTGIFILNLFFWRVYNPENFTLNKNRYAIELEKNGQYEFFSAFFNNILNYRQFYPTIDNNQAFSSVRSNILQPNQKFLNNDDIERYVNKNNKLPSKKYNVMLIVVESLSAKFMKEFGNNHNITPNLDKIAQESIFFTNLYAVGTRTVRGLEAISLSIPPTPGSSIIRRPNNSDLFNAGTIFRNAGYDISFIFGGYSYFDNLYEFYSGNNYKVIDRVDFRPSEISFSNVWGVADEDLFNKVLQESDNKYKSGKAFFSIVMTTSNHRPYTFPDNRIDLPSGGGRNAAVKYTDYAIGKFIEEAKNKPWFSNTIFIITADHCASSAGKTDLPALKYHIPLMIFNPQILEARRVDNLASQIDIVPTILGILNFDYKSKLWGADILNFPANRALISTYQLLGYMDDKQLVILAPNNDPKTYRLKGEEQIQEYNNALLVRDAISLYQSAYDFYTQGKLGR